MNVAIKMPFRLLNPGVVRGLQEKYPAAIVSIEVEDEKAMAVLEERQFWDIIARLDGGRKRSEDIVAPAVEMLSHFSVENIYHFDEILAEKLHALDGEVYARALGWGQAGSRHFSVDGFLYARCCAVANGASFYESVLKNPSS